MRSTAITVFSGFAVCVGLIVCSPSAEGQNYNPNMSQKLNQLEAETQNLRAELDRLQDSQPQRLPSVDQPEIPEIPAIPVGDTGKQTSSPPAPLPGDYNTSPAPTASTTPATETNFSSATAPPNEDLMTLDEMKAEMKKLVWKKGDFSITPYGFLWTNMAYETERTNNGDYTLWAYSAQEFGDPTFNVDAKNTRLGFDVVGPRFACLNCAQSGGKVEIDFQGNFVTENKGTLLLRHAYFEIKDEQFRLLAGQTWDVISPLNPNSIMYSVYWDAGNIGYRRPQFRAERYMAFSDTLLLTVQGSVNADVNMDTVPAGITNDHSGWPLLEGRAALTIGERGKGCLPTVVGVSSHVGEYRVTFPGAVDLPARTWSLNGDIKIPINECWGFQGEIFTGENLSTFLGGIGQGYDFTLRQSVYSQGGWFEAYHYWNKALHSHAGLFIDDPNDANLSAATARTYNQVYFGNIIYDVTKQFSIGLEVSSWRTLYKGETPGESVRTEFMAKYGF